MKISKKIYEETVDKIYKGMFNNPKKNQLDSIKEIIEDVLPDAIERVKKELVKKGETMTEIEIIKFFIESGVSALYPQVQYQIALELLMQQKASTTSSDENNK